MGQDLNRAWKAAGLRWRSTCRLGSNPGGIAKIKKSRFGDLPDLFNFMVRQAGFEPAAYGFVVRRSVRAELRAQKNGVSEGVWTLDPQGHNLVLYRWATPTIKRMAIS